METRDIFRAGGGPEGDCFEERKHLKMEERQDTFHYTYSARQQSEIEQIRSKYLPPEENKMDQLRRLDRSATQKGTAVSIAMGVVGCLLLGVGMCCTMVWVDLFIVGIVVGDVYKRQVLGQRHLLRPPDGGRVYDQAAGQVLRLP